MKKSVAEVFDSAVVAQRNGNLHEADKLYTSILKKIPNHGASNHNLGALACSINQHEKALPLFERAVSSEPRQSLYWISYLEALLKCERLVQAQDILKKVDKLKVKHENLEVVRTKINALCGQPNSENSLDFSKSWKTEDFINHLAKLYQSNDHQKVIELCSKLNEEDRDFKIFHIQGASFIALKMFDDAIQSFKSVVKLSPEFADAYNNLGTAFKENKNFDEALENYKKALLVQPIFPEALYNMGLVLKEVGQLDRAVESYKSAIKLRPTYFQAHNNLGIIYRLQGKNELAIESYTTSTDINPNYHEAFNNLSVALYAQGYLEEALKACKRAIEINPKYIEAYINLGNIKLKGNNLGEALVSFASAQELDDKNHQTSFEIGSALYNSNHKKSAVEYFTKATTLKKDFYEAEFNLGNTFYDLGRLDEAINCYKKATRQKKQSPDPYNNLGNVYQDQAKWDKALACYEKALEIKPESTETINNLAILYQDLGQPNHSINLFERASALADSSPLSIKNLATAYSGIGDVKKAKNLYKSLIDNQRGDAEIYRYFSLVHKFNEKDRYLNSISNLLKSSKSVYDRCQLSLALSKAYDDIGKYEISFKNLQNGNSLRKRLLEYSFSSDEEIFERINSVNALLKNIETKINTKSGKHPIFIVGMMRSGTTLVEQIISSHSKVFGGGELNFAMIHAQEILKEKTIIQPRLLDTFRASYLKSLDFLGDDQAFITDKMPQNFLLLNIILKAIPEAKIVHVRRNPQATCWSNFRNYFTANAHGYSYSIADTVAYFNLYQAFMHAMSKEYPNEIIDIDYDQLVSTPEKSIPNLINRLGLCMESPCLHPELNKRLVRTTSQHQVRKKIYKNSSESWKNYAQFLSEPFKLLKL